MSTAAGPGPEPRPGGGTGAGTGTAAGLTYADAGVDLAAADEAVALIAPHVERTRRSEVLGGLGGFGGMVAFPTDRFTAPVLVSATDGVGTKVELGRRLGRLRGLGVDLVAMVVDDLVCSGAEPLFFLDYLAVEKLDPAQVEELVAGIADGCVLAGCALVGGETAEHPGVLPAGSFDLAGFGVGVVERAALLGPQRVAEGDALVALASNGLHANGYSLARRIVDDLDLDLHQPQGPVVEPLVDALLRPTRIYAPDCLALGEETEVQVLCHVTGGGVPGNLPRVLPEGLGAVVDVATVPVPPVIELLCDLGQVAPEERWRTFNMGIGMLAVVADPEPAVALLAERGVDAWTCGEVVAGEGVTLAGR